MSTLLAGFTPLARGVYLEGLAVDAGRGLVWYSDVVAGGIHAVTPAGERHCSLDSGRRWIGGLLVARGGLLLASGEGGIRWYDPEGGRSGFLVREVEGRSLGGVNEMAPDGRGGLFFGELDLESVVVGRPTQPVALWHLAADGALALVAEGIGFANGLAYDPARRALYCNDTFRGVRALVLGDDWRAAAERFFHPKADCDGLALDEAGHLWVSGFASDHFVRLAPDGAELPAVPVPAGAVSQLRFGQGGTLYFTAVPEDGGERLKEGRPLEGERSVLWRARAAVQGAASAAPDVAAMIREALG
ncbi:MAG: hypothetical protein KatS3mg124_1773 [Porticoccaceae bacterium]|nr:MAG: hypothetical protein KatS3mg124_1773 [Porticoccaceae bacterium]